MTRADPYDVTPLLDPWVGLADDGTEIDRYAWVDPADDASLRRVIVQDMVPYVATWDDQHRERAKVALQFALTFGTEWFFQRCFDSSLPPFETPVPARRLFEIVWNELFGEQDWRLPGRLDEHLALGVHLDPKKFRMDSA